MPTKRHHRLDEDWWVVEVFLVFLPEFTTRIKFGQETSVCVCVCKRSSLDMLTSRVPIVSRIVSSWLLGISFG